MSSTYNIYCDESCHLPNDREPIMVLGALWCPEEKTRGISKGIKGLRKKHGLASNFEIKWTKVSPAKLEFYKDAIDFFFDERDLHFRAIIAQKTGLNHEAFSQDHDEWYYKMFFRTLQIILRPDGHYRIYLDIKDTHSKEKVKKLHDVLCKSQYDFDRNIIERIQQVSSKEVALMQIADLLIGSLAYVARNLKSSPAKLSLVEKIRQRSGYSLRQKTLLGESKFNIFYWTPHEGNQ